MQANHTQTWNANPDDLCLSSSYRTSGLATNEHSYCGLGRAKNHGESCFKDSTSRLKFPLKVTEQKPKSETQSSVLLTRTGTVEYPMISSLATVESDISACVIALVQPLPSSQSPMVLRAAISVCRPPSMTMNLASPCVRPAPLYLLRISIHAAVDRMSWQESVLGSKTALTC